MQTLALIGVVLGFMVLLEIADEWWFPPKPWVVMEDMMNDGVKTSLRLLAFGLLGIVVVFGGMAFGWWL